MTSSRSSTLLLAALALLATSAPGRAEAEPATPVCVYASRSYSDGAFLCVQKSVALICRSDGGRIAWSTVTDKDLADRCTTSEPPAQPHRARLRTAYPMHRHEFVIDPAKCFEFSGKRYCE